MPFKRRPMRYAHTAGYTHCTYTDDGSKFLTCGADGDVRIWAGVDDDDPFNQCVGEYTICVVQYENRMLVSTDLNTVQAFTLPDCSRDGTEFRFTGTVTCIKVNKNYIAACSEDMEIKVKGLNDPDINFQLTGNDSVVLKIDLSPNDLLAASDGDGKIIVWDLNTKEIVKTVIGLDKTKTFNNAKTYGTPSFDPKTGNYLAYPNKKEVIVLETKNWAQHCCLNDKNVSGNYATCNFSPCGKYVAAGSISGEISIWELKTQQLVKGDTKGAEVYGIASISWNPLSNGEMIYCDITGQLGLVEDCFGQTVTSTTSANENMDSNDLMDDIYGDNIDLLHDDNNEDEDNENCVSLEKLKNETLKKNGVDFGIDDFGIDDKLTEAGSEKAVRPESRLSDLGYQAKSYPQQPPFQPSSTPNHLDHRYLLWNHIGVIRSLNDDKEKSIQVEFHDASFHHTININNFHQYTMASLSNTVLVLSKESPSKLSCIGVGSSGSREWSVEMPGCEEVLAVCASSKVVAVATDSRLLRVYGVMGTQREVISIPGPVVALAGFDDKIMVTYHAAPATEDQFITVMLVQVVGFSLRCRETKLPLTPHATLNWIGFSDKGSPVIYDSMGWVRMYSLQSNLWFPVCDTNLHVKGASDNFFIVEVSESTQVLRAVLCRGTTYPLNISRHVVNELPLSLPFCDIEAEQVQLEESLVRLNSFIVDNSEKQIKEIAIKLFAWACRSEKESRAKELIEMIASPQLLPLAMKYASKLGRMHLAESLGELLPVFEEQEKEKQILHNTVIVENEIEHTRTSPLRKLQEEDTPKITPKPVKINSHNKRNPFKRAEERSANKNLSSLKPNPLSHLTSKAIGLYKNDSDKIENDVSPLENIQSQDLFDSEENTENIDFNKDHAKLTQPTAPLTFVNWFKINRDDLQKEFPDATPPELTKYGLRKFKTLGDTQTISTGAKRKLDDGDKTSSGVSKLAKFGFTK